jgi:hypothetical protein
MRAVEPSNQKPSRPVTAGRVALLAAATLGLVAVLVLVSVLSRGDRAQRSPVAAPPSTPDTTAAAIDSRSEIVARLREILRIRDRAIETRDETLLHPIYTVDCPCLKGDSSLISRLKRERLVWRGIRVSLQSEKAERVNDRLWIINAIVVAAPFRIEKESGEIVRRMPQGQESSRFALSRPVGEEEWLLGQASLVEQRG